MGSFGQTNADSSRQKLGVPPVPLTDEEVDKTFFDMEGAIRHRLRLSEIIPVEMSDYRIGEGAKVSTLRFTQVLNIRKRSSPLHSKEFISNFAQCTWKHRRR